MQTTLLGLAIAVILALLAALIGPFFVDWNAHRAQFETEASRIVGLPVRVAGNIDVRLLPTPSLRLNGVQIGRPGQDAIRANALGIEMALGPLVRGQLRASEMLVSGPQLTIKIGKDGRPALPAGTLGFDTQNLAIDLLTIEEARLIVEHAASAREFVFEKLWFKGEARSLAGSFRGDGAFIYGKELFGYRINAARQASGEIKTRFTLDPSERALSVEGDGLLTSKEGVPQFEGVLNALRRAGTVLSDGRAVASEPWRLTAWVKAGPSQALFENVEYHYGPDERALKVTGTAALKYETAVRLEGVLSASQLDIDRLVAKPEQPAAAPFQSLTALIDGFEGVRHLPFSMQLGVSIDSVKIGGGAVQSVRGDLRTADGVWRLDGFELRAPGVTQVRLSGRADVSKNSLSFRGPADISSADPRQLLSWLEGREANAADGQPRPMQLRGDIMLDSSMIAIERLHAAIDRRTVNGRLVYMWPADGHTGRLDTVLKAEELDADGLIELGRSIAAGVRFERPGEISLAMDVARARLGGVSAQNAKAKLEFDKSGLTVERFEIGDLGGVALKANGRIDTTARIPRGELSVDLDGRELAGLSSLVARYAPDNLQPLRTLFDRLGSVVLQAKLAVSESADANAMTARLDVNGRSGDLRLALKTGLTAALGDVAGGQFYLDGRVNAADGARLLRIAGIDGAERAGSGAGSMTLHADGTLAGSLKFAGAIAAPAFAANARGTAQALLSPQDFGADFTLEVSRADLVALLEPLREAGRMTSLPIALSSKVSVSGSAATFENIVGNIAGSAVKGRMAVDLGVTSKMQGELSAETADGAAMVAVLTGMPARRAGEAGWAAEPFRKSDWPDVVGQIDLHGRRVTFGPTLTMSDATATLRLAPKSASFEKVAGKVEGGRVNGEIVFRKTADVVDVKGQVAVDNADAASLIAAEGRPVLGNVDLRMDFEGSGLSPKALIGSLNGSGTISVERARLAALDPRAFAAAISAADRGVGLEPARIAPVVRDALNAAPLEIATIEGALSMAAGQIRLATVVAQARGAELSVSGRYDLGSGDLDARLVLAGEDAGSGAGRPEIAVALRGDAFSPQRTVDVSSLSGWLALRAVEQQAKKLEALERARAAAPPPEMHTNAPATETPPAAPSPPPAAAASPAERSAPQPRARVAAPSIENETRADIPQRAAPLPPPLVITPAPGILNRPPTRSPSAHPPPDGRTF